MMPSMTANSAGKSVKLPNVKKQLEEIDREEAALQNSSKGRDQLGSRNGPYSGAIQVRRARDKKDRTRQG